MQEKPNACVVPSTIEPDADFVILNYDIAAAWQESLIAWRADTCIADEVHDRRTTRFQATLQIVWACNRRYLLTGTPIVNCPRDLIALINSLGKLKSAFGGWHAFVERYCEVMKPNTVGAGTVPRTSMSCMKGSIPKNHAPAYEALGFGPSPKDAERYARHNRSGRPD